MARSQIKATCENSALRKQVTTANFGAGEWILNTATHIYPELPSRVSGQLNPEESKAADSETLGGRLGAQAAHERESARKAQVFQKAAEAYHAGGVSRNKVGEAIQADAKSNTEQSADKAKEARAERAAAAASTDKAEKNKHNHRADDIDLEAENVSKVAMDLANQAAYQFHLAADDFETESRLRHEASREEPDRQKGARMEDESIKVLLEAANSRRKSGEAYRHAANEPGNPDSRTKHGQAAEQFERAAKDRQRPIDTPGAIGGVSEKQKQQNLQQQDDSLASDEKRKR
jgi:hypothetical protein